MKSPRRITYCASKELELDIPFARFSTNCISDGGLYATPSRMGFVLGKRISMKTFSNSSEKSDLTSKAIDL